MRENMNSTIEAISSTAFKPFGELITTPLTGGYSTNDGTAIRFDEVAKLDLTDYQGSPLLSIFRVMPISFPFTIRKLERHPHSSQAFIPLISHPFLSIVAPPSDQIDPAKIKIFYVPSGQGVNYARGTWHHQVIALEKETSFLVVGRKGQDKNCDEIELQQTILLKEGPVAQMDRAEVS
ncbi:MAG: ureidoglycolate lyase [Verrucomicrobiae bacterium]|nr:ureidoglycolate lyase [Verrucomicrobiae bacterium]